MYEMKPEYYIGIAMIDEEHKQLFKYADEAYELLHEEFTPDKYDDVGVKSNYCDMMLRIASLLSEACAIL